MTPGGLRKPATHSPSGVTPLGGKVAIGGATPSGKLYTPGASAGSSCRKSQSKTSIRPSEEKWEEKSEENKSRRMPLSPTVCALQLPRPSCLGS